MTARISHDLDRTIGQISPLLFGSFLEHMGRAVYGGVYQPGSPLANEQGMRRDVLEVVRRLGPTIMRYPGGNFLSGYHWLDGVGPHAQRPRRRELAWQSTETNQFGTDEFLEFCRQAQTEPMLGVNLGTGTLDEAAALVEYCNAAPGTYYADMRARNGRREPYGVRYWCLGNEMDGPWQIGHLDMDEYARKAREAAKMMKWQDPAIQLILCGSSGTGMATYPEWDRTALETCWEHVDYLSLHSYVGNRENDTPSYLALASYFEDHLDTLSATLRYVKAKLRSKHDVKLSWDEWNVWYKAQNMQGAWAEAPHLIEEVYNLEDALVVSQWLNVFLRRCDTLHIACLAQLVNIIAPILTTADSVLLQSTFFPFEVFRKYAAGQSLDLLVQAPVYANQRFGESPVLDVSGSFDPQTGRGATFIVNRSLTEALPTDLEWKGRAPTQTGAIFQFSGSDPKAANTFAQPGLLQPTDLPAQPVQFGKLTLNLAPLSLTVVPWSVSPDSH